MKYIFQLHCISVFSSFARNLSTFFMCSSSMKLQSFWCIVHLLLAFGFNFQFHCYCLRIIASVVNFLFVLIIYEALKFSAPLHKHL